MRKICVITGSRAEYGILSNLMKLIKEDALLDLQIIATNMHLSPEFGLTYQEIEKDGFFINKKVHMMVSSDTPNAVSKSIGLGTIGFADAYEDLLPDLILVLGDRYEILAAVSAALLFKIPVAHLHGGEITEGAYDDSIRHAITKLSHLHFTSTEAYRRRVIQLGEAPGKVYNVGALGVENITNTLILSKKELEQSLNFNLGDKSLLVTYHPVTLENNTAEQQFLDLLFVLNQYKDYKIVFTMPNSDTNGRVIMKLIDDFVSKNEGRAIAFASLGRQRYFSALNYVSAVIGNSSSGIIEVPSFGIPTLNIGDRQKGRIAALSVINCEASLNEINEGMQKVLSEETKMMAKITKNPYFHKETSFQILDILKNYPLTNIIQKTFYDLPS
ncbi:UDP-N-acetylglucosamine 2-epimerase [Dysgonomonas macrotermitis]|uniref:UDP-N-acetylglucosamine 2-epimerase (Non-hydrolysing)/GDP/UDP-N,N'-diacetylbacillosamine 2-epimerase (Hydrolysing) n=1 Tax=Dysgonomonas macrotermitis TaxID=1346286 RepID=A0A1M5I3P5_9BACT|nr:UDP-N-acetylglucosamine 2-epimerase [Dysgonomonas macrotermitis]SHG22841.1 UDP-N-acetylglucosamine 2-epimerase (non-hydrolysing)/GDP/UDP-N,N'-diacetylbacillosamine 2-epimerase (hydrolysing) [Dysgonomonas macrotermitis]